MSVFNRPPPAFSPEEAQAMVFDFYGLRVTARSLDSERDQNFLCSTPDYQKMVLKISNPDEDKSVLEMQNECMQYIHDHGSALQVPFAMTGNAGNDIFVVTKELTTYFVRLVHYLPGLQMKDVTRHESMLYKLGSFLGHLCQAMSGFDHPAADRDFPWDVANIDFIKAHKNHIPEGEEVVDHFIGLYEENVIPNYANLRKAVIHNDSHGDNLLVTNDGDLRAIIDFGDLVYSFVACEPAVCMNYVALEVDEPLQPIAKVLKGFHETFTLTSDELLSVIYMICIRSCITVTMAAERKKLFPENEYIFVTEDQAWKFLHKMQNEDLNIWSQELLKHAEA